MWWLTHYCVVTQQLDPHTHYSLAPCSNTGQVQVLTREWNTRRANTLPVSYHITVQHTLCSPTKPFTHPAITLTNSGKHEWRSLTVQPGFLSIHGADLCVGVFDGGVVVWHKVGLWETLSVSRQLSESIALGTVYTVAGRLLSVSPCHTWLFSHFPQVCGSVWKTGECPFATSWDENEAVDPSPCYTPEYPNRQICVLWPQLEHKQLINSSIRQEYSFDWLLLPLSYSTHGNDPLCTSHSNSCGSLSMCCRL